MDSDDRKALTTLRLEPRLKRAAKHWSTKYADCPLHTVGSWAWYMRQAVIEKLVRDGFDLRLISDDCSRVYEVYTSSNVSLV